MEALPLFLDRLLNPVAAILISVTAILLFGEVLPQAVCKRYGLHVGAYLSWLVRLLMWATLPISYPLGKLLDWLLGQESVLFRRAELRALVSLHAEPAASHAPSMLTAEEVTVIHGALDMANKTASTAMTPLEKVFMVGADDLVDRPFLQGLIQCGHSRIPVYDGGDERNIIGLILVKEMVLADLDAGLTVRQCRLRDIDHIVANTPLYSVLELFRFKRRHMAALTKGRPGGEPPWEDGVDHDQADGGASEQVHAPLLGAAGHSTAPEVVGIITIEDVIEELLQTEIVDETDVYVDNMQTEAVPPTPAVEGALPPQLTRWLSKGNWPKKKVLGRKPSGNTAAAVAAMAAARQVQRGGANSSKEMQFSDV